MSITFLQYFHNKILRVKSLLVVSGGPKVILMVCSN